jgi:hypothetical protein
MTAVLLAPSLQSNIPCSGELLSIHHHQETCTLPHAPKGPILTIIFTQNASGGSGYFGAWSKVQRFLSLICGK